MSKMNKDLLEEIDTLKVQNVDSTSHKINLQAVLDQTKAELNKEYNMKISI